MTTTDTQAATTQPSATTARGLSPRTAFGICAGLLLATSFSVLAIQKWLNVYLDRGPVPLHKSLDRLDKGQLAPYRFQSSRPLPDEVVDALGTRDYIQWVVEDTRRQPNDPLRFPILFVTYYTGGRTNVPHTPERCFIGANFSLRKSWPIEFSVTGAEETGGSSDVSAKALVFGKADPAGEIQQTILYTFYANCEYASERNYLRFALMKPGVPNAFFSKVEVAYTTSGPGFTVDPAEAAKAGQDLMQTVLPILMREHWPRPEELTAARNPASPGLAPEKTRS